MLLCCCFFSPDSETYSRDVYIFLKPACSFMNAFYASKISYCFYSSREVKRHTLIIITFVNQN